MPQSCAANADVTARENKYQIVTEGGPPRIGLKPPNRSPIAGAVVTSGYTYVITNDCGGLGLGFLFDGKNIADWDWSDKDYVAWQAYRFGVDDIEEVRKDVEMLVIMGKYLCESGLAPEKPVIDIF